MNQKLLESLVQIISSLSDEERQLLERQIRKISAARQVEDFKDQAESVAPVIVAPVINETAKIIRTERGLAIAGTRITLYDVMDYLAAQYPPKFIQGLFDLTEEQINAALTYIETNREAVESEYAIVLEEAEELRQYYEEKNRALIARLAAQPPKPGQEAVRAKLQAAKAKLECNTQA